MEMAVKTNRFVQDFEELNVYQLAYQCSLELHQKSKTFPRDELFGLTNQLRRCSKSVCANIAEGFVKQSQSVAEFGRFLSIAIGSAGEMRVWLRYCHDLHYITTREHKHWHTEYISIVKMLQKLRSTLN